MWIENEYYDKKACEETMPYPVEELMDIPRRARIIPMRAHESQNELPDQTG